MSDICICQNVKEGSYNEKEIAQGDWNAMYIRREGKEFFICALGDGYVIYKIDYCPKCGRKL